MPPVAAHGFAKEFSTDEELRALSFDLDGLRTQSLLICERVLGPDHKDTLFRLMYRGAAYADSLLFQRCIDLWIRALEFRVAKDTVRINLVSNSVWLLKMVLAWKKLHMHTFSAAGQKLCAHKTLFHWPTFATIDRYQSILSQVLETCGWEIGFNVLRARFLKN